MWSASIVVLVWTFISVFGRFDWVLYYLGCLSWVEICYLVVVVERVESEEVRRKEGVMSCES